MDLGDVAIADSLVVRPPAGGTVLIESTAGPIAAIAPRDSYQDAVLGFEIVGLDADGTRTANTNWPIRPSFPTFWLNVLEYLATRGEEQESAAVRPGQTVELQAPAAADRLTVVAPDRRETTRARDRSRTRSHFTDTDTPGIYQVRQGDAVIERFAVNLFDRAESDVARAADAGSGEFRPCGRPTFVSVTSTLRPRPIVPPPDRRRGRSFWRVPCSCWCWNGISTTDGYISNCPALVAWKVA